MTIYDFNIQVLFTFVLNLILIVDYKAGFGGKYGVQNDRVDKCAVGWEHKEDVTKHESQTGINETGFTFFNKKLLFKFKGHKNLLELYIFSKF